MGQNRDTFTALAEEISTYPVDIGHKLNVHKTFRRRPGRLLNTSNVRSIYVLCLQGRRTQNQKLAHFK